MKKVDAYLDHHDPINDDSTETETTVSEHVNGFIQQDSSFRHFLPTRRKSSSMCSAESASVATQASLIDPFSDVCDTEEVPAAIPDLWLLCSLNPKVVVYDYITERLVRVTDHEMKWSDSPLLQYLGSHAEDLAKIRLLNWQICQSVTSYIVFVAHDSPTFMDYYTRWDTVGGFSISSLIGTDHLHNLIELEKKSFNVIERLRLLNLTDMLLPSSLVDFTYLERLSIVNCTPKTSSMINSFRYPPNLIALNIESISSSLDSNVFLAELASGRYQQLQSLSLKDCTLSDGYHLLLVQLVQLRNLSLSSIFDLGCIILPSNVI
eukprot:GHVH01002578.1.p1 GENE.GHVH01002578.1~~GHVH01002578.1.p1  ORF type:complete len:321 (+),score=41.42 GHVH01002578.1:69-1031(+)